MAKLIVISGDERQEFELGAFNTLGRHPDNTIQIKGSPASGFCVQGINNKGTATGPTVAFWYDSIAGGLKGGPAGASPFNGACQAAGSFIPLN